jgi:hypothetical protein
MIMGALKTCRYCELTKPVAEFHRNTSSRDGLDGRCKSCRREIAHARYMTNREVILKSCAQYYAEHRTEVLSRMNSHYKQKRARAAVSGAVKPLKDGVARLSKALNNKGAVWPPRGCWDVQRVRQNGGSSRTWVSQ